MSTALEIIRARRAQLAAEAAEAAEAKAAAEAAEAKAAAEVLLKGWAAFKAARQEKGRLVATVTAATKAQAEAEEALAFGQAQLEALAAEAAEAPEEALDGLEAEALELEEGLRLAQAALAKAEEAKAEAEKALADLPEAGDERQLFPVVELAKAMALVAGPEMAFVSRARLMEAAERRRLAAAWSKFYGGKLSPVEKAALLAEDHRRKVALAKARALRGAGSRTLPALGHMPRNLGARLRGRGVNWAAEFSAARAAEVYSEVGRCDLAAQAQAKVDAKAEAKAQAQANRQRAAGRREFAVDFGRNKAKAARNCARHAAAEMTPWTEGYLAAGKEAGLI